VCNSIAILNVSDCGVLSDILLIFVKKRFKQLIRTTDGQVRVIAAP